MWIVFRREPRPDARYWPGRRVFAVLDAVVWPALLLAALLSLPFKTGVVGWLTAWVLLTALARRAYRAWFRNENYWFTTARYAFLLAAITSFAMIVKALQAFA